MNVFRSGLSLEAIRAIFSLHDSLGERVWDMRHRTRLVVILVVPMMVAGFAPEASGQSSPDELVIPKIKGEIELDGRIEESAWTDARRLPAVQHMPNFGADPTENTELLIGYTEDYLYAACRCYDRLAPSTPSFRRDYFEGDSDYFGLVLDTFNDNENALGFLTTPTGLRTDLAVFNDASGDRPIDFDRDTFWSVEVRQHEDGWFAEMRIPVSSLRFTVEKAHVTMGLSMLRFVARESEWIVFPEIPPEWGNWSRYKPSQFQDIVFEDVEPRPPLRVTPYLLGGVGQQSVLNNAETAYERQTDPTYDAGLDVKYGLTSNFTLDLTLNTDFAQVEADDEQVNLTRFPLFFPEKRRFFLERASTFAFGFGQPNRLFYSRRIGLHQGKQVRILGGARMVGRQGPWDIGILDMQTARESQIGTGGETLPSENFGVVRVQRDVMNEDSHVGGILIPRLGLDGTYNVAYGLDGLFRVESQQYLTAKWAQTFQDGIPNEFASLDPTRMHLRWEDRAYSGFNYNLRYDRAGRRYEPGVGLELRDNYFRFGDRIGYGWVPGEGSSIQRHRLNLEGEVYVRNADGTLQSLELGPEWEMTGNAGHSLILEATRRVEDLRGAFALPEGARVPAGRYAFYNGEISYGMPSGWDLRTDIEVIGGSFYDGWRSILEVNPTWNVSRYLRISGFYQLNRIGFPDRNQQLTAHVGRLRAEVTPNVEYSISAFVQYNSAREVAIGNLRFRYNPRQGNDLYLVYNERLNTGRFVEMGPRLPLSSQRAVMLKYTYTFNW